MKKISLLLIVLSFAGMASAQSLADKEKIVQQCINLKPLEQLYANEKQLYILEQSFPFGDIHPSCKDKEVSFLSKNQLKLMRPNAHFLFWIFDVTEKKARVLFAYNYDQNSSDPKDFKATVLMEKEENNWIIKHTQSGW